MKRFCALVLCLLLTACGQSTSTKPSVEPTTESTEQPAESSTESTEQPTEPATESIEQPAEASTEPTEQPAEAPSESTEQPAEAPTEPTEQSAEAPTEATESTEQPAESSTKSTEQPTESTEQPSESTTEPTEQSSEAPTEATSSDTDKEETQMLHIQAGESEFTATWADNSSVDALKELLAEGPLTLTMSDYAQMEKGADLGVRLPQNNQQMNTTAGDIILYQGRTLVIYYDQNSWSLTPIAKIEGVDAEKLRAALGDGDVTVTFSLE